MTEDLQTRIAEMLRRIEGEHCLRILYACESGSRVWGYHSHALAEKLPDVLSLGAQAISHPPVQPEATSRLRGAVPEGVV